MEEEPQFHFHPPTPTQSAHYEQTGHECLLTAEGTEYFTQKETESTTVLQLQHPQLPRPSELIHVVLSLMHDLQTCDEINEQIITSHR